MNTQGSKKQVANDSLSVQYSCHPGCLIELVVQVSPAASQAAQFRAVKEVRKEVSLPGFRKGHVPENLLKEHFAKQIEYKAVNVLAETGFAEAVTLIGRPPFTKRPNSARVEKFSPEQGSELHFEYEAEPVIPKVDVDSLPLEEVAPTLPPTSEAEKVYNRLRALDASLSEVDRAAAPGDAVSVRIFLEGLDEPQTMDKCLLQPELSPGWLQEAAVGMKAGETKDLSAKLENEDITVRRIEVVKVMETDPPQEDEAFFKKFGATTKDDVLSRISHRLDYEAQFDAYERMRRRLRNELIRLCAFDLPQSLVESETEARLRWFWDEMSQEVKSKLDKEAIRKEFLEEVKRYLTLSFLFRSMMPDVNPSCTKGDVQEELLLQARVPPRQRIVFPGLDDETAYHRVLLQALSKKCEEYCIKQRLGVSPPVLAAPSEDETKSLRSNG